MFKLDTTTQKIKKYIMKKLSVIYYEDTYLLDFEENNKNIGKIYIPELIKYAIITLDTNNTILPELKIENKQKVDIIEKYICNTYITGNTIKIEFISPNKSLFMTDIELLIKLSKDLMFFEEKYIKKEPMYTIVFQMINNLLNIILKSLYSMSYNKKSGKKDIIFKYSSAILNKLNTRLYNNICNKMKNIEDLYLDIKKLNINVSSLSEKVKILNNNITEQTTVIQKIIDTNIKTIDNDDSSSEEEHDNSKISNNNGSISEEEHDNTKISDNNDSSSEEEHNNTKISSNSEDSDDGYIEINN